MTCMIHKPVEGMGYFELVSLLYGSADGPIFSCTLASPARLFVFAVLAGSLRVSDSRSLWPISFSLSSSVGCGGKHGGCLFFLAVVGSNPF